MKVSDVVKFKLPFHKEYVLGVILEIMPCGKNKYSAEIYWDDDSICGTMTKYLETVCKSEH